MTRRNPLYLLLGLALALSSLTTLTSCNKDKDKDEDVYTYSTSTQTTLVNAFSLQDDSKVLTSLDSVHFTIDYDNGLIYNADSLPVGTDISALKVNVQFMNTVSSAFFKITGATVQPDTTIEYSTSMTNSLDFTGRVVLTVTSADETQVKDYDVKVLVHKYNPDSLIWNQSWRRDLPGYRGNSETHKAVLQGDLYRFMSRNAGETILYTATSPDQGTWSSKMLDLPFTPDVMTLTATDQALFMLSTAGELFTSPDGLEWTSCGVTWHSLLGAYEDRVLGITGADGFYYHDEYPRVDGFVSSPVEEGFPVSHSSGMIVTDNDWAESAQAMIAGGLDSNGNALRDVWGYDGNGWARINNIHSSAMPALTDATLFMYYTYKPAKGVRRYSKRQTWYLMGGRLADGSLNGDIYLSDTQGITWYKGDSTITQPDHMPKFYGAQAFVNTEVLNGTGAHMASRRVASMVTSWDCPFIYLFGGYNDQGYALPYVWRGVYIRLTNYPVY